MFRRVPADLEEVKSERLDLSWDALVWRITGIQWRPFHADAIVGSLRSGQMPCDGAWAASQVEKLQQWIDMGKPA